MSTEVAKCRGCGMVLKGEPYYKGGAAYHPRTGDRCKSNFFGGFVCSSSCDRSSSLRQLSSIPGAGEARHLDDPTQEHFNRNWRD